MNAMSDKEKEIYRKGQINGVIGSTLAFLVFLAFLIFNFWSSGFVSCMTGYDKAGLFGLLFGFIVSMLFFVFLLKVLPRAWPNRQP